jgi:protein-S-isoprenylcysteine O-methyltransferase Ste14
MLRDWLLIAASVACLGSFGWALRGHFRRDGRMPLGMRLLSAASLISFCGYVWQLWQVHSRPGFTLLGLGLFAASFGMFWWSIASTRTDRPQLAYARAFPHVLQTSGPYRLVRHPFYASYIVFWLATALTAGDLQWLAAFALTTWYVLIARHEERRFDASPLEDAYNAYRERTGMLCPLPCAGRRRSSGA